MAGVELSGEQDGEGGTLTADRLLTRPPPSI